MSRTRLTVIDYWEPQLVGALDQASNGDQGAEQPSTTF